MFQCLHYFLIILIVKGQVQMPGLQTLKLYTRKIVSAGDSELDVSAPSWDQQYETRASPERKSEDGYEGISGPRGDDIRRLILSKKKTN